MAKVGGAVSKVLTNQSLSSNGSASRLGKKYDRLMLEWCCGEDSLFGMPSKASEGCNVIRLTKREDMTSKSGVDFAKSAVNAAPPNAHMSIYQDVHA